MLIWKAKASLNENYTIMKSPSSYKINLDDYDGDSYKSIATGNLIDNVISTNWSKLSFDYSCKNPIEVHDILQMISNNPIYVIAKNPLFPGEEIEAQFKCKSKSMEMLETGDYTLSFSLEQKKKVGGQ